MKRRKCLSGFVILIILIMIMTGCSSGKMDASDKSSTGATAEIAREEIAADTNYSTPDSAAMEEPSKDYGDKAPAIANSSAVTLSNTKVQSQDKIIQNYYLDIETQDFDQLITNINTKINSLGGYVESSQIGGKSFYDRNVTRSGNIVARIPNNKAEEFVNVMSDSANVINSRKDSENVSLQYIDVQSRVDALEIEQDRLFAILEKSEDLENIITLESRLSDIRYELQNYKSQLRALDNKVEYSTVKLTIQEVTRITPTSEAKQTLGSRIKNGFRDTMYHISEGFKDFLVWFLVNIPYLLIWGVIIFLSILLIRSYIRKSNKKRLNSSFYVNNSMDVQKKSQDQQAGGNEQSNDHYKNQ